MSSPEPLTHYQVGRETVQTLLALECEDIPARLEQAVKLETVNANDTMVNLLARVLAHGVLTPRDLHELEAHGVTIDQTITINPPGRPL